MKRTYDLIIIGNSESSLLTAEYALNVNARTGLFFNNNSDYYFSFLNQYKHQYLINENSISYQDFLDEKKAILKYNKIKYLQRFGLDIIHESYQFINNKTLFIKTKKDILIAPHYLLNLDVKPNLRHYNNIINTITIDELIINNLWNKLPDKIAILGNDLTAIYLAKRLQKIGKQVSLFSENDCLLPYEDEDISWQLQLYLEAKGIKFHWNHNHHNFLNQDDFEKIIIAQVEHKINDSLGLAKLGIKIDRYGLKVNAKLQTNHPQIYACGDIIGGYSLDSVTEYEAQIALNNALFIPWQKVNYEQIPYYLNTEPSIARIGCTQKQAESLLVSEIKVISLSLPTRSNFGDLNNHTYYLKIILDRYNHIIGFHTLGVAPEIFTVITTMITNNQPLNCLFKFNFSKPSSYQLIKQIKQKWLEENDNWNDKITSLRQTFLIWKNNKF